MFSLKYIKITRELNLTFSIFSTEISVFSENANEVTLWVIPLSNKCTSLNSTRQNTSWAQESYFKKKCSLTDLDYGQDSAWTRLVLRIRIGLNLTNPCDCSLKTLLVMHQSNESPPSRPPGHSIHLALSTIRKTYIFLFLGWYIFCAANSS